MNKVAVGIGAALLLAYLWNRLRPLTPSVTTSEFYDTDEYAAGSTSYPPAIREFAQAIARAEGYGIPGAIPTVANNPGDLAAAGIGWTGPSVQSDGSVGRGLGVGIAVFPSADYGWSRLYRQLGLILSSASSVYNLDMSIREMGLLWSGGDANWSRNVADYLNVSEDTKLWAVLA